MRTVPVAAVVVGGATGAGVGSRSLRAASTGLGRARGGTGEGAIGDGDGDETTTAGGEGAMAGVFVTGGATDGVFSGEPAAIIAGDGSTTGVPPRARRTASAIPIITASSRLDPATRAPARRGG